MKNMDDVDIFWYLDKQSYVLRKLAHNVCIAISCLHNYLSTKYTIEIGTFICFNFKEYLASMAIHK